MELIANELHKPARKNFPRRSFKMLGINETVQVDLIDMQNYAKENKGNKYILTLIDIFSKKAYAVPLKDKSGLVVTRAIKAIIPEGVKNIQSDAGKEFFNKHFKELMKTLNINHYHTFSTTKAAVVERFQRTLKGWLYKQFTAQGNYNWLNLLPKLIKRYNNKIHRSIGMKPNEVSIKNSLVVHENLLKSQNKVKLRKPKYRVGDSVRISKFKHLFEKGYLPNYSTEIFTIFKVNDTKPVTYVLKDETGEVIRGGFYEQELYKTKYKDLYLVEKVLKTKGDLVYVKWLGFKNNYNSWVHKKDLVSS